MHPQFTQYLSPHTIIAFICQMPETNVGIYCIHTVFLKFIRSHLFHQTNAPTLLVEIYDNSFTGFFYHLHRLVQLLAAITTHGTEYIPRSTGRMYTHQHRFIGSPSTLKQGHMLQSVGLLTERNQAEMSMLCRHIHLYTFFYDRFLLQTVSYHIADRNQFQIKFICHFTQFGQTCHRTVFVHDLHKRAGRIETRQTTHINRSFGMTSTT